MAFLNGLFVSVIFGQSAPNQTIAAVTNKIAIIIHWVSGKSELHQGRVRRVSDISERVEERPVQIEKYALKVDGSYSPMI